MTPRLSISVRHLLPVACLALTPIAPGGVEAQTSDWPESCRLEVPTIFDRPIRIVNEPLPVPDVPRHEPVLGIEGRLVEVEDGVRLWVEEVGEGPPLLLISGGPGTSHHYFHPHLVPASAFARLIYVDLRGVGQSDRVRPEGGYGVGSAVDDLEALREALDLQSWSILGNSFGGIIAQQYAVDHPERIDAMVLTSSAIAADVDLGIGVRQRDFMSAEEMARVEALYTVEGARVAPVHGEHFSEEEQREVVFNAFMNGDWKRRHLCEMSVDEIARFARYEFVHDANYYDEMIASWQSLDLREELRELQIPTLIIEGRWDLAFAEWKPERMRRAFPQARLVMLEDAGHTLFEDDPQGFFSALQDFMADVHAAPRADDAPSADAGAPVALTRAHARAAAAGAREEARANGWAMVVAVLDEAGVPLLVERMDGAQPASVEIALAKARAAWGFRRPTAEMEGWVRDGATHLLGLPGIVPIEGGVPIRIDGRVVGAIGVSGATSREDGLAAKAALRGLSAILDRPARLP